jgi:hypothetical protein
VYADHSHHAKVPQDERKRQVVLNIETRQLMVEGLNHDLPWEDCKS